MNDFGGMPVYDVVEVQITVLVDDVNPRRAQRPMGTAERLGCSLNQLLDATRDGGSPQSWINLAPRIVHISAVEGFCSVDSAVTGHSLLRSSVHRDLPDIRYSIAVRGVIEPLAVARPRRHHTSRWPICYRAWCSAVGSDEVNLGLSIRARIKCNLSAVGRPAWSAGQGSIEMSQLNRT